MKAKTKIKVKIVSISMLIIMSLSELDLKSSINSTHENSESNEEINVKIAGFWNPSPFVINESGGGNFTWAGAAATQPWCSGSGTFNDPYIIENVTINGENSNSGITIIDSSSYFIIRNNTIYNTSSNWGDAGIKFENVSNGRILNNNVSANNQHGIYLNNSAFNVIQSNGANNSVYAIVLEDSDSNIVSGNIANDNDWNGFYLYRSKNNTIIGNIASNNGKSGFGNGIYFWLSTNNTVSGNNLNNNKQSCLSLITSSNNTLIGNFANDSIDFDGIFLSFSNDNVLTSNIVSNNNRYGILLANSGNNTLLLNNITSNSDTGIEFQNNDNSTVIGNRVIDNGNYGIRLLASSENNLLYFNNLTGNIINNSIDDGSGNQWNNSKFGNFWSDYGGIDSNSDGIGDTPRNILGTAGSQDQYPILIIDTKAPVLNILNPMPDLVFGNSTPSYVVEIIEDYYLNFSWYTIDGGLNTKFFTNNGTINQTLWNAQADGALTIEFYANDTFGNVGSTQVTIQKDTTPPTIIINTPKFNDLFGNNSANFNISINDSNFNSSWYGINTIPTNKTFTGNRTIVSLDQTLWDLA